MDGAGHMNLKGTVAPLRNVMLLNALIQRVQDREEDMPGLACFYGPSGYGKTKSATWNAQHYGCYWVEMKATWSRKKLMAAILKNMGLPEGGTVSDMCDRACEQLLQSERPLLIDEADLMMSNSFMGLLHDLNKGTGQQATIILIGEEEMPQKLRKWERIHNRMLDWVPAQPADLREVGLLANLRFPHLKICEEVQQEILERSHARARRIVVNLRKLSEFALERGIDEITSEHLPDIEFYTGEAPSPRGNI